MPLNHVTCHHILTSRALSEHVSSLLTSILVPAAHRIKSRLFRVSVGILQGLHSDHFVDSRYHLNHSKPTACSARGADLSHSRPLLFALDAFPAPAPCTGEQLLILPGPSHVIFSTNTLQHLPPPHWRLSMAPWCTVRCCALPSLPAWPLVTSSPCLPHQGGNHQPPAPPT